LYCIFKLCVNKDKNKLVDILTIIYNKLKIFVDNSANWFEVIGFIGVTFTSIKVFFLDKRILKFNDKHLFQVRGDNQISILKIASKNISDYISNFDDNKLQLKNEIKRTEEITKNITKKLKNEKLQTSVSLLKMAKRIEKQPKNISDISLIKRIYYKIFGIKEFNKESVEEYYFKLTGFITSIEEYKKDKEKSLL